MSPVTAAKSNDSEGSKRDDTMDSYYGDSSHDEYPVVQVAVTYRRVDKKVKSWRRKGVGVDTGSVPYHPPAQPQYWQRLLRA